MRLLLNAGAADAAQETAQHGRDVKVVPLRGETLSSLSHGAREERVQLLVRDRKSTRLNSSHQIISYAVFCLKKKKKNNNKQQRASIHHIFSSLCPRFRARS